MDREKTLKYLQDRFEIDLEGKLPIKLDIKKPRGLTSIWNDLDCKVGAEIGVARGLFSKWICAKVKGIKLFCIDPYVPYDDYIESRYKYDQEIMEQAYKQAQERVERYNAEFIRKTSMDALEDFLDNSLDFVFIDGNHTFEYAVQDIAGWSKKVKPGGIVAGHDYWMSANVNKPLYVEKLTPLEKIKLVQVKAAVDGWTTANQIKPWFITRDYCWFYVKSNTFV